MRAYYAPMMNTVVTKATTESKPKRRMIFYPMYMLREKFYGWQSTGIETFRLELSDFVSLCGGGSPGAIADGAAGLRAIEIAQAIYRSSGETRGIPITGALADPAVEYAGNLP